LAQEEKGFILVLFVFEAFVTKLASQAKVVENQRRT
jgi:hypothetical protein